MKAVVKSKLKICLPAQNSFNQIRQNSPAKKWCEV
jgi:hypothetical protein